MINRIIDFSVDNKLFIFCLTAAACPPGLAGALLHFYKRGEVVRMPKGRVTIVVEHCKGCGFCVEFCPPQVLALSTEYNSKGYHTPLLAKRELCTGCDICGMVCPDFAIYGYIIKKKTKEA